MQHANTTTEPYDPPLVGKRRDRSWDVVIDA